VLFVILILLSQIIIFIPTNNSTKLKDTNKSNFPTNEYPKNNVDELLSSTPTAFTENRGQLENNNVRFYDQGGSVWFTDDGVWFEVREEIKTRYQGSQFRDQGGISGLDFDTMGSFGEPEPINYKRVILKQEFVGANLVQPVGRERLSWNSNFFYGNDSEKWCSDVPNYAEVYYENLYDGIDLRYYTNERGLKYDFIVHPGADPNQIRLRYQGAEDLKIDNFNNLIIKTEIMNLIDTDLFVYQYYKNIQHKVEGKYKIYNNLEYGFEILDSYDKSEVLVIDPWVSLNYSTFIGGFSVEQGFDIKIDTTGCAYVTGFTNSSNFPTVPGSYDTSFNNGTWLGDIFIIKLNSMGSKLIYSTFIGGGEGEWGIGIEVDSVGNVYLTGEVLSSDFPTTPGAYDRTFSINQTLPYSVDSFVLKLDPTGSKLIYSTFVGGNNWDAGFDIAIDTKGNSYVTGATMSSDFPTTLNAYDTSYNYYDVFVFKLNHNGSKLIYSTLLGGSITDLSFSIEVNSNGSAYIVGYTDSPEFPTTPGAHDTTYNDNFDVFVCKLNWNGSALLSSTFIGGTYVEMGWGLALDSLGNTYVTGWTESLNFPTTSNAYANSIVNKTDVFVCKLNHNMSTLLYSTYFGGNSFEGGKSIAIDSNGNAVIAGTTFSSNFPTTLNAYDRTLNGSSDHFMFKLNPDGSTLLYSTYIGGSGNENQSSDGFFFRGSVALDMYDNAYITGETDSFDFPITSNAFDKTYNGFVDTFVVKFIFQPVLNITSVSLLINTTHTNLIYSRLCPYTFRINITYTKSISDLEKVYLRLKHFETNIQLEWDRVTDQFSEFNDPNNYVSINSTSNGYNCFSLWTIDFNVTFNWNYPDEGYHDVQAYATSAILAKAWYNVSKLYRVENDLVYNGTLSVKHEDNEILNENDVVRGGEKLNWTGLKPVYEGTNNTYPPNNAFDICIWDEIGSTSIGSPESGENFNIQTSADIGTDLDGNKHIVNIIGVPPECDKTNCSFTIRIDGDNVSFSDPKPKQSTWQNRSMVEVGINITDLGGGIVLGSSVMHSFSIDNKKTWTDWKQISKLNSSISIEPVDTLYLNEGVGNFLKWKAEDSVGNGPEISDEYRIDVDTEPIIFSNATPTYKNVSYSTEVEVGISIADRISGVNASTIEYKTSNDSGKTWTTWNPVNGLRNGMAVNITLNLSLNNGTSNRIKWRASDLAGNGPTESKANTLNVDIPRVRLWQPRNNSILTTQFVELSWILENRNLLNVLYDIYLDTVDPPVEIYRASILDTKLIVSNLSNGETYCWRAIPRIGKYNGSCISGIWSFTMDIPIPSVTLQLPLNNSILTTLNPTLTWMVEYEGDEELTYSVFLDNNNQLDMNYERNTSVLQMYTRTLQDSETYYWKVIPWVGNIRGKESEVYSFTINLAYIPKFELALTLDPTTVQLEPGGNAIVKANVTNLGELTDSIILNISGSQSIGVWASINIPNVRNATTGGTVEFIITVGAIDNAKKGEIEIMVGATSGKATEYGITYEEKETLKVVIFDTEQTTSDKSSDSISIWIIPIVIVIIIFAFIILFLLIRRKKSKKKLLAKDAFTIKSVETPTPKPTLEKPPIAKPEVQIPAKPTVDTSQQITQSTTPKPTLAASPTVGQIPVEQQIPEVEQKPKLPPAINQINKKN
jgi:hypothetical protein